MCALHAIMSSSRKERGGAESDAVREDDAKGNGKAGRAVASGGPPGRCAMAGTIRQGTDTDRGLTPPPVRERAKATPRGSGGAAFGMGGCPRGAGRPGSVPAVGLPEVPGAAGAAVAVLHVVQAPLD